jgi:hypothetical protein
MGKKLSVGLASKEKGCSPAYWRNLCDTGGIPFTTIGTMNKRLIDEDDIDAHFAKNYQGRPSDIEEVAQ